MNIDVIVIYIKLVSFFGSQTKTAKALSIKQPSVNAWLTGKSRMSEKIALRAEYVTNGRFKAYQLCPTLKEFEKRIAS
ncbi:transcriptional regulator [Acinetobacter baumannii]|uniref:transcriptional regulator n=1 Tax=Acinetobacter baumannii TaxID=470 RepID=UPI00244D290B|nr:YdaS family helix-turn-helix protein [Acinetobacter baumannii]MDH2466808.1 YdaS family helix-turn-helix protein [Acinetobacter baumannii]MDO7516761.1 YdaS family helix-turn-helix protein [Acinetobacter baumannii]HCH7477593.1 helix-turn-helix domain-containing protein [Acinetobacter baumannii]